jgi:hypothetical protein
MELVELLEHGVITMLRAFDNFRFGQIIGRCQKYAAQTSSRRIPKWNARSR